MLISWKASFPFFDALLDLAGGSPADYLPRSHALGCLQQPQSLVLPLLGGRVAVVSPLGIATSRYVADQLVAFGVEADRIEVIPNGITIQRPPVQSPASEDLLALARHDVNKNLPALFRGVDQLQRRWPQWRGVAHRWAGRASVAPGATHASTVTPAGAGAADRCAAAGELLEYLRSSLALLSASTEEGFDYPVLEAKAEGTPTLISDIPVHREFPGTHRCFSGG